MFYTHYRFLTLKSLPDLAARDVNILEMQGCMRVPTRDYLKSFLNQYFRHIHPLLPIVPEGDFWARYTGEGTSEVYADGISLLLLQAMMFASSNVGNYHPIFEVTSLT